MVDLGLTEVAEEGAEVSGQTAGVRRGVHDDTATGGGGDQAVAVAEVAVEGGLGHSGAGSHLLERDALDAGSEQELDGCVECRLVRLFAPGSCHEA